MDRTAAEDERNVRLLGGLGIDASASRAALAVLKPLNALVCAAEAAGRRLAHARSDELWLRTVEQAEATLSVQSLVTAYIRDRFFNQMVCNAYRGQATTALDISQRLTEVMASAWEQNPRLVALSRRNLEVLLSKWRAGTLSILSVEEQLWSMSSANEPFSGIGARLCATSVRDAIGFWPDATLDAAALRDVHDAICALLETDAAGELFPDDMLRPEQVSDNTVESLSGTAVLMLYQVLIQHDLIGTRTPQQIMRLVRGLGLSSVQENALSALQKRTEREMFGVLDVTSQRASHEAHIRDAVNAAAVRASAAEARYGLQRCTLPACAAQEPAARTYKKCSRCGQAYYCCVEHQQADWKRHKREDGCKKPS